MLSDSSSPTFSMPDPDSCASMPGSDSCMVPPTANRCWPQATGRHARVLWVIDDSGSCVFVYSTRSHIPRWVSKTRLMPTLNAVLVTICGGRG